MAYILLMEYSSWYRPLVIPQDFLMPHFSDINRFKGRETEAILWVWSRNVNSAYQRNKMWNKDIGYRTEPYVTISLPIQN